MKKNDSKPRVSLPPCRACNGLCCRHIALEIDAPKAKADFDNIRWYLMHENVKVGMDHSGEWLLEIPLVCRHLKKNSCAVYPERPDLCRKYPGNDDFCEFEDKTSPYRVLFTDERVFERYMTRKKKRRPPRRHRRTLPVYGAHAIGPHQN